MKQIPPATETTKSKEVISRNSRIKVGVLDKITGLSLAKILCLYRLKGRFMIQSIDSHRLTLSPTGVGDGGELPSHHPQVGLNVSLR